MAHELLSRFPCKSALVRGGGVIKKSMGQAVLSLLVAPFVVPFVAPFVVLLATVGFTSPSFAQAPDLLASRTTVSDTVLIPGTGTSFTAEPRVPFLIETTVLNLGNGAAAATTLRFFRSADDEITTTDSELATLSVEALEGQTAERLGTMASITNAGNYWVGACVDTVAGETKINNNCSEARPIAVFGPPDLIVTDVSVSNSTPAPGATFTINATARNSGGGSAAATTLRYYRSVDSTITTSDTPLGTDAVGGLSAGGSSRESTTASIATARTWWVGACIDTVAGETPTTNNCSSGVRVTTTVPDLTVTDISVSNTTPAPGATFTINATVRNSGNGASTATTLSYYRSTDRTISTSDTRLGPGLVGALAAGASARRSTTVSIANAERYWVGACIGTVSGEINTDNNCSSSVEVTVTAPPPPDLTVTDVSVSNTTPAPGATFTINATVRNSGGEPAAATTLRYYRSTDRTISTADTRLGEEAVDGLAAGGSSRQSTTVVIANAESYWVGACVGTVNGEAETGNNCSSGVLVSVTAPAPTLPDITVDNVSVSASSVETDVSFTINATVRNSGNGAADATTLRYFRSANDTITTDDTEVATDPVEGLAPNGFSQQSAVVAITDPGTWWVGACVGTVNGETETDNNCSVGVQVTVTAPTLPDLTVDNVSVSESSVEAGTSFTINATARNSGTGTSTATTLRYFRSDNATISTTDTAIATDPVGSLAPSGFSQQSAVVAITEPGTWWVGACIGPVNGENATDNNCSVGVQVTVTGPALADLTVGSISVAESNVEASAAFTINATVRNQGTAASPATMLHYYSSPDSTITASDTLLATQSVEALAADASSQQSAEVVIAEAGTYWVGACVADEVSHEAATDNCSAGVQITVTAAPPDNNNDGSVALPAIIQLLLGP